MHGTHWTKYPLEPPIVNNQVMLRGVMPFESTVVYLYMHACSMIITPTNFISLFAKLIVANCFLQIVKMERMKVGINIISGCKFMM